MTIIIAMCIAWGVLLVWAACDVFQIQFNPWWQWHCRRSGGLMLGLRCQFPHSIVEDDGGRWTEVSLTIGLLCASLHIDLLVPRRELPLREPKATVNATAAGDGHSNQ